MIRGVSHFTRFNGNIARNFSNLARRGAGRLLRLTFRRRNDTIRGHYTFDQEHNGPS